MSAKFIPHRCGRVMISICGKVRELTMEGIETVDEKEIADIKASRLFGVWVVEEVSKPVEKSQPKPAFTFAEPIPVPTLGSLDANDIALEEAAIAEQVAIREQQAREELVMREVSKEVDDGIKSEIKSRRPGGKDPANGKSKKPVIDFDAPPKKRGRPPKAK